MTRADIYSLITRERARQDLKHPPSENMLPVLVEEVGEVARALQGDGVLRDELIQVAAVCVRWLEEMK